MELRQLEHFVAVAEERSFTRAAQRLHLVQSAVSASIRTLERDLEAELLSRTTQRVALTDAGATLLPQARRILAEVAAAQDLVADVRGGLRGSLTIGTMQALSAGPIDVPGLLGRLRVSHPRLQIRLRYADGGSSELAEHLRDGRVDVAIVSLPDQHPAGISLTGLTSEPMALVCPPGHRLAGRRSVRLSELGEVPFIEHPAGWGTRMSVDRAFAAAGIERQVAFEVADTPSVINLVRNGLGLAFLPRSLVAGSDDVRFVALRGRAPVWEVSLALPSNRPVGAAARAFSELAGAAARADSVPPSAQRVLPVTR
jgi:DNA-binding transcriptional LysR family regulator